MLESATARAEWFVSLLAFIADLIQYTSVHVDETYNPGAISIT